MNTIHLQGYGKAPAIPLSDVRVGDVLLYNYGITGIVVAVEPVGTASMRITTLASDGKQYTVRRRATTLQGIRSRANDG